MKWHYRQLEGQPCEDQDGGRQQHALTGAGHGQPLSQGGEPQAAGSGVEQGEAKQGGGRGRPR